MYLPTENLMVHSLKSISSCMLFGLKPTVVQETYMQLACPLLALRWSWNKYPLSMLGTAVLLFYPSIWQARTDINRPCLLKMNAVLQIALLNIFRCAVGVHFVSYYVQCRPWGEFVSISREQAYHGFSCSICQTLQKKFGY